MNIFQPKPLSDALSFHVCWSSAGCFICTRFTSFFLPLCLYLSIKEACSAIPALSRHPDPPYCCVAQRSSLARCLQMPEPFCALGSMQRSNGHNSVLWTTEEGECQQRSPLSTLCARMKRLADHWLIEVSRITPVLFSLILAVSHWQLDFVWDVLLWFACLIPVSAKEVFPMRNCCRGVAYYYPAYILWNNVRLVFK